MRKFLALLLCLLMVILFVGCKGGVKINTKNLEQAMIDGLYAGSDLFESNDAEFLTYIEENNEFKVISFEQSGDIVTAEVEVTSPDLYSAAINLASISVENNLDEVNKLLIEEMKKADSVKSVVEIEFEVSDNGIKAILTDEFLDAYYGGVFKLREKQLEDIFTDADSSDDKEQPIDADSSEKGEATDESSDKNTSKNEKYGITINKVECSGYIKDVTVEISSDGYLYQSDEEWLIEMSGKVIHGKITFNKDYSESELESFAHGGILTYEDGTSYENDELSFWSDYEAGEFAVDIPDDIKGAYKILIYQSIGTDEGEISIDFTAA